MKKISFVLFFVVAFLFIGCSEDESQEKATVVWFSTYYKNLSGNCNTTTLNFTFLVTRNGNGLQESHTVAPGETVFGSGMNYEEGSTLNVKVFAASSPDPLHEANIPFIYNDLTNEQIASINNELIISYCHEEDTGNITWLTILNVDD